MNIILSTKENHPVSQAELGSVVDLNEKKVLFVYGLANSRGEGKISSSIVTGAFSGKVANAGYDVYNPEDEGNDTPEVVDTVRAFWEREGFQVAVVGIAKNIRATKLAADYTLLLRELHTAIFTSTSINA